MKNTITSAATPPAGRTLPWHVKRRQLPIDPPGRYEVDVCCNDEFKSVVAYCGDSYMGTEAIADFIVRACNAHDELLEFAKSARNAFEERLSCLDTERVDAICDGDEVDQELLGDIDDQIGNYRHLLEKANCVITKATP